MSPKYIPLLQDTNSAKREAADTQIDDAFLCAVAIISEGVLSVFSATSDVWWDLTRDPS